MQACSGVAHLHALGIIHRNLAMQSMLLYGDAGRHLRLCDFSCAISTGEVDLLCNPEAAHRYWMAPAATLYEHSPTTGLDTWSLGVLAMALSTGILLFESCWIGTPVKKMVQMLGPFPAANWPFDCSHPSWHELCEATEGCSSEGSLSAWLSPRITFPCPGLTRRALVAAIIPSFEWWPVARPSALDLAGAYLRLASPGTGGADLPAAPQVKKRLHGKRPLEQDSLEPLPAATPAALQLAQASGADLLASTGGVDTLASDSGVAALGGAKASAGGEKALAGGAEASAGGAEALAGGAEALAGGAEARRPGVLAAAPASAGGAESGGEDLLGRGFSPCNCSGRCGNKGCHSRETRIRRGKPGRVCARFARPGTQLCIACKCDYPGCTLQSRRSRWCSGHKQAPYMPPLSNCKYQAPTGFIKRYGSDWEPALRLAGSLAQTTAG